MIRLLEILYATLVMEKFSVVANAKEIKIIAKYIDELQILAYKIVKDLDAKTQTNP